MRLHRIHLLSLAAIIPGLFACTAPRIEMNRLETWTIVLRGDASPGERYAAEEFQALFEGATGYALPILDAPPLPVRSIYIGPCRAMELCDAGFMVDDLGGEGFRISINENNIAIAGGGPRGTLYGVYEFFERYLGVRFLTADHTYIPDKAWKGSLPCETYAHEPPFAFRWSYYAETRLEPAFAARLRVNTVTRDEKYGGVTAQQLINHSLHRLLPVQVHGEKHPEYFALVKEERKLDMWGGGPEPCVTHPDVIDLVVKAVIEEIEAYPGRANVSVSQNDNDAYCRCARCEAVNQREESPMGAHLAFVNAVADQVKEKHPEKMIGTLSYWYTRKPPKTIRPRENVQIQFADIESCRLHGIEDPECPKNRPVHADLEGWKEICDQIYIWSYATNFRYYDLPFPNFRALGPNIQYFARLGVKGVFMQANGGGTGGEFSDLRNYVIARLLFNPGLDGWSVVEEFCRLHYGYAGPILLEYLAWMHDKAESRGLHPGCFSTPMELGLDAGVVQKMFTYFTRARAAAENEAVRDRVEKASITAYRAMLESGGEWKMENWRLRRVYPEAYGDVIARYIALCKKHQMTMPDERTRFDSFEKTLNDHYRKGYPAAFIENDTWRLTVLNEENGKAIEMLHKPSGRNLVNALANSLRFGTFEEWTGKDQDRNATSHKYEAAVVKNTMTLSRKIDDAADYERKISLADDGSGRILCETKITHRGESPKTYQLIVHPEFNAGTSRHDWDVLSAYVKQDGKWVIYNKGLIRDEGPDAHLLLEARDGGGHAYFNHEEGFGVLETYETGKVERLRTWWRPEYVQINLEIMTKAVALEQGESFSFSYAFEFLEEPPQ